MTLTVTNLSVTDGARTLLAGVSLTIQPGQVTAVIGANGAGKSELVLALAGMLPISAGTVTLVSEADSGCRLSGLPGMILLAPDGVLTEEGTVVGSASGTGARVTVRSPDGGQWLFCAAGGGCP